MSILYGILKEHGRIATLSETQHIGVDVEHYGTGIGSVLLDGRLGMGVHPVYSHERSTLENGPVKSRLSRHVLSFDGRLDNYESLCDDLRIETPEAISDSVIVLAAFDQWGESCFSRFVGDWALALWSKLDRSLYLARDHAGTRTLYYRWKSEEAVWGTFLETFHVTRETLGLSHDYAACYMSGRPARDLTPYEAIRSVPPGHFLKLRDRAVSQHQHWSPTVTTSVRYRTDAEYEEHFFESFQTAVERRSGPGAPVLAQLSGGMDSTSIVCMSDYVRRRRDAEAAILDTVSYFDDSEASLDERPYFSATEAQRGKAGTHINTAFSQRTFQPHDKALGAYLFPGADSFSLAQEHNMQREVWKRDYRGVLSGIGGDEVLGGVPDPLPELADYLTSGQIRSLCRQCLAWSLVDRTPILTTLSRTVRYTRDLYFRAAPKDNDLPPWITPAMRERALQIEVVHPSAPARIGIAPHRLDNSAAWWHVMETLPHLFPQLLMRPEYRYPFLDKDLVNFLFSIPREQILRPGRRRSLMRRALVNIVPNEVLERRRKAYQQRAPLRALQQASAVAEKLLLDPMVVDAGFADGHTLRQSLRRTVDGDSKWWAPLFRTIAYEIWLRSMAGRSDKNSSQSSLELIA